MTSRLEGMPALPLAVGALTAVLALEACSFFEYILLVATVAASIFFVIRCGKRAALTAVTGMVVAAASYFISHVPDVPYGYVDGSEAEYVFHIDKANPGRIGQRCEATVLGCDGQVCPRFKCSVVVTDVPFALSQGDIVSFDTALRPVGMFSDVPYMSAEDMYFRTAGIGASALVSFDDIRFLGRHENFHTHMADMRDAAARVLYALSMSAEVSSTLATALLGVDSTPKGVKERFRAAGLSHLLCISGFHICIIAWIVSMLLFPLRMWRRFGRMRYIAMALLIWAYVAFIGFPPSAVRAAVMLSSFFIVRLIQRQVSPYNTLALAVAMLIFIQPLSIFDPGFQLSVCAVLGLLLFADKLNFVPKSLNKPYRIVALFAVPLAAMLGTAPVVLAWFHHLPLLSVPANACASLLFPPFMLIGIAGAFTGMPVGRLSELLLNAMKKICDYAAGSVSFFCSDTVLLLLIAAIGALAFLLHRPGRSTALMFVVMMVATVAAACSGSRYDGAMMVCGNDWNTQICVVDGGKGYIFTARSCRKSPFRVDDFFEGHGADPSAVVLNPDSMDVPFVVAAGKVVEWSRQADYLIIDKSFNGDVDSLIAGVQPSVVILGAGISPERQADIAAAASGRELRTVERKAFYSALPSNPSPLRK